MHFDQRQHKPRTRRIALSLSVLCGGLLLVGAYVPRRATEPPYQENSSVGERYALIVGIESYQSTPPAGASAMSFASREARSLRRLLTHNASFKAANIAVLTDDAQPKPTKNTILTALRSYRAKLKPQDLLLVFYCGHGFQRGGKDMWMPWDADQNIGSSLLPVSTVLQEIAVLPARRKLLINNICRFEPGGVGPASTDFTTSNARNVNHSSLNSSALSKNPASGLTGPNSSNTISAFACSPGEFSSGRTGARGSVFYLALEKGLQGAAADRHGTVTVDGLMRYMQKSVFGTVKFEFGLSQIPRWQVVEGSSKAG